jgi:hypothetical protein
MLQLIFSRRYSNLMPHQPNVKLRLRWHVFAFASVLLTAPAAAGPHLASQLPANAPDFSAAVPKNIRHADILALVSASPVSDIAPDDSPAPVLTRVSDETHLEDATVFASMSGSCSTLKIAGRDFECRAVAFFQSEEGRANFVIALEDPDDDSHTITFSGDNGRRTQDNLYELPIDRMLLKSSKQPRADGLPVPLIEVSAGACVLIGSFATAQVASVSCSATDKNGQRYELRYESDGLPVVVKHIKRTRAGPPAMSPFD